MDTNKIINFLKKPDIKTKDLEYVLESKKVYVNLFEIKMNKDLTYINILILLNHL